jgi:flagellar basal body-associated protein FliL
LKPNIYSAVAKMESFKKKMGVLCCMNPFQKKADASLGIALVIVLLILLVVVLANVVQRECKSNKDCGSAYYCGSDYSCHEFPTIQKTVVQNSLIFPSIILGISIVAAAIIFNWHRLRNKKENGAAAAPETKEGVQPETEKEESPKEDMPKEMPNEPEEYYEAQSRNP